MTILKCYPESHYNDLAFLSVISLYVIWNLIEPFIESNNEKLYFKYAIGLMNYEKV